MDNGLVLTNAMFDGFKRNVDTSLNPYCSGQWSRTLMTKLLAKVRKCLNPYCSGQWSRTTVFAGKTCKECGLNPYCSGQWSRPGTEYYVEINTY